jgi:hypothetical protein
MGGMRLLAGAVAIALLGLLSVADAGAQTPGTLAGETLQATPASGYDAQGNCLDPEQCVQATGSCDPDGTSSVSFTAVGTAVGPYPGTFTTSGTVTFSAQVLPSFTGVVPSPAGANTSLTESFTIQSDDTTITGTKQLAADVIPFVPDTGVGACRSLPGGYAYADAASAIYTATLTGPSGSHTETGNTYLNFGRSSTTDCGSAPVCNYGNFAEAFYTATQVSGPATVTLSPPDAVNTVGTSHTVTATVRDSASHPVQGVTVLFKVSGSVNTSGSCTTNANGQCSFTYQGPNFPGADLITGCADSNDSGTVNPGEPCDTATKAWLLPASTPGQVTGGGQVPNAAGNDRAAFGFTAKNTVTGPKGQCTFVDPSPTTKIKCASVTALAVAATHATLFGNATINGQPTTYRIDVDDIAEPGRGRDTFRIQTTSGYIAGGTLTAGNIQVHR